MNDRAINVSYHRTKLGAFVAASEYERLSPHYQFNVEKVQ
jgi:hypothetical protein